MHIVSVDNNNGIITVSHGDYVPGNIEHSCFIVGSRIPETCYPSMIGAREWRLRCGHCFREWWVGDANERPDGKCDARV